MNRPPDMSPDSPGSMAGQPWSDHPECVCTVLGTFGRALNDTLPDGKRQRLVPLVPELLATAGDGHAQARSYMALDWLIRTYLPTFLALTERIPASVAQSIRDLPPIVDIVSAKAAGALVRDTRGKAAAAWAAAWVAAGDAAGDAAWAAAWVAAWVAAGDAAWAAAGDAVRDAAGAAAGAAVRDAARDAARAAARAAARDAARAAARDAARDALAPAVEQLQDSAIDLYTRMIRIGK